MVSKNIKIALGVSGLLGILLISKGNAQEDNILGGSGGFFPLSSGQSTLPRNASTNPPIQPLIFNEGNLIVEAENPRFLSSGGGSAQSSTPRGASQRVSSGGTTSGGTPVQVVDVKGLSPLDAVDLGKGLAGQGGGLLVTQQEQTFARNTAQAQQFSQNQNSLRTRTQKTNLVSNIRGLFGRFF